MIVDQTPSKLIQVQYIQVTLQLNHVTSMWRRLRETPDSFKVNRISDFYGLV